eukprot:COSAG02_NODE_2487_length_8704_cov_24.065311_3_plen_2006_part_00
MVCDADEECDMDPLIAQLTVTCLQCLIDNDSSSSGVPPIEPCLSDRCEGAENDCDPLHALCIATGPGTHECRCAHGWNTTNDGRTCQDIDECASTPCQNGGHCYESSCASSTYPEGTPCDPSLPGESGVPVGDYRCECAPGFANGQCAAGWDAHSVMRSHYFELCTHTHGGFCDVDINECISNPCQNSAECFDSRAGIERDIITDVSASAYKCACQPGFANGVCNSSLSRYETACSVSESTASPILNGNCNMDIDECSSTPCQNAAACADSSTISNISFDAFRCTCRTGYASGYCLHNLIDEYTVLCEMMESIALPYGQGLCQVDINECDSNPCQNGAVCSDSTTDATVSVSAYRCTCADGFASGTCEYAFLPDYTDECTILDTASAAVPATGNCELDVDECLSDPCQNGAACIDSNSNSTQPGNAYECVCPAGFGDDNCDRDIDECSSTPCMNGGICAESNAKDSVTIGSFQCTCRPGYASGVCEYQFITEYTAECTITESSENSTRTDGNRITVLQGRCEIDVHECSSNPCQNGGLCGQDSAGDDGTCATPNAYSCDCPPGWFGQNCEINNPVCSSEPCKNGAHCTASGNSYNCTCTPGWTGPTCTSNVDDCAEQCVNSGVCVDGINSYSCVCAAGYTGLNCAENVDECISNPCQHEAICAEGVNAYSCICVAGFDGDNCEVDIDECSSGPCQNGANCIDSTVVGVSVPFGAYRCECVVGYSSGKCNYVNEVSGGPDDYDELCSIDSSMQDGLLDGAGNCAMDVDECVSNPCQNGAECSDSTVDRRLQPGGYRCACIQGYSSGMCDYSLRTPTYTASCTIALSSGMDAALGMGNCEVDVNECASSPCINGATCSDSTDASSGVAIGAYACNCLDGFASGVCSYEYIPQYADQCSIQSSTLPGLFAGSGNCEVDVDECASTPCANSQPCVESGSVGADIPISDFSCDCGRFCRTNESEIKPEQECDPNLGDSSLQTTTGDECEIVASSCYEDEEAQCDPVNSQCISLGAGSFECVCNDGWEPNGGTEGTVSTGGCIDIDECGSSPCQNGGICTESACAPGEVCLAGTSSSSNPPLGSFRCTCAVGYANGVCADGWDAKAQVMTNWYTPDCTRSTGGACDIDIDECMSAPCMHEATCAESGTTMDISIDAYRCTCLTGYTNGACDYNRDGFVNRADAYLVQYTERCTVMESTSMDGNCDVDVNECDSNPCQNGAECLESSSPAVAVSLHAYVCMCTPGFANGLCGYTPLPEYSAQCNVLESDDGSYAGNCDIDVDECASSPCRNGATCTESSVDSTISLWAYRCTCVAGYSSGKCDYSFIAEVATGCSVAESSVAPISGAGNCEIDVDECSSSPCANNATCTESLVEPSVSLHAYQCTCLPGFANGACSYTFISEYTDECTVLESSTDEVWGGNCDIDVNECNSSPCVNGAKCSDSVSEPGVSYHAYQCTCQAGFANGQCDYEGVNAAYATRCSVLESSASFEYSGNCDIDVDECISTPCSNGALCRESTSHQAIPANVYQCSCVPGFANGLCEYDFLHGSDTGTVSEIGGMYADECTVEHSRANDFTGNCDIDIDECVSSPCHHDGTCSELEMTIEQRGVWDGEHGQWTNLAKLYSCNCTGSWISGSDCEVRGTFSWACERGQMPVDPAVTNWDLEPPRIMECRECEPGRYSPDGVRCRKCSDVAPLVTTTCSRVTNLRGVILREEWPCTRQYTCIKCPQGLVPNNPDNATHCVSAMDSNDTSLTSLGDSIAPVVPVATLDVAISGEPDVDAIVQALANTMGVDIASLASKEGGPPNLVCVAKCCDDLTQTGRLPDDDPDPQEVPIDCACDGSADGNQRDPFDTCVSVRAAGRRRAMRAVPLNTLLAAGNMTRRLQDGNARDFSLEFVIQDDPLAQIAIDTLSEQSQYALSGIDGASIGDVVTTTICPEGKVRAGPNVLCQQCPYPDFTPDAVACRSCPDSQVPTDDGNALAPFIVSVPSIRIRLDLTHVGCVLYTGIEPLCRQ